MVLKRVYIERQLPHPFENDVKMYGTQTMNWEYFCLHLFENDVKMYGTQTVNVFLISSSMFENDVKMYGT